MKKISIAFITDEKYALPTRAAIRSVVRNKGAGDKLAIYIIAVNLPESEIKRFESLGDENAEIKVVPSENTFENIGWAHGWVSYASLLKFNLPNILGSLGKVLYLDGDLIVTDSLADLWNTDLGDAYAGVVLDSVGALDYNKWHLALGLERYFNSGVMLLNLDKMRADGITEKLLEHKKNDGLRRFMDQDQLNAVFGKQVLFLGAEWNVFNICLKDGDAIPKIIHYASGDSKRPWLRMDIPYSEKWIEYVDNADFIAVLKKYFTGVEGRMDDRIEKCKATLYARKKESVFARVLKLLGIRRLVRKIRKK